MKEPQHDVVAFFILAIIKKKFKDLKTSKTGYITITVKQHNGIRFKTLGKNVLKHDS